jgi:hypothetical protein
VRAVCGCTIPIAAHELASLVGKKPRLIAVKKLREERPSSVEMTLVLEPARTVAHRLILVVFTACI